MKLQGLTELGSKIFPCLPNFPDRSRTVYHFFKHLALFKKKRILFQKKKLHLNNF